LVAVPSVSAHPNDVPAPVRDYFLFNAGLSLVQVIRCGDILGFNASKK